MQNIKKAVDYAYFNKKKVLIVFHSFLQKHMYMLHLPHQGNSNEYPQYFHE